MKTLAIDFDGVIHAYSRGWQDGSVYDEPMPGAREALETLAGRYRLEIFTARDELNPVLAWLGKHGLAGFISNVTNVKPKAALYLDDRAMHFQEWPEAVRAIEERLRLDSWEPIFPPEEVPEVPESLIEQADRTITSIANELERLRGFTDWLISMDDPESESGLADRRTITLTEIIYRAGEARS